MEAMTLLLLCTVAAILLLFIFRKDPKRTRLVEMLEKLPGPPTYPLFGTILPLILTPRNQRFKFFEKRFRMYKSIYCAWVGREPTVNVMHPEYVEIILGSTKHIEKSFTYKFLHPWLGTGLLTSSGQKWHTHRKLITPTFHFKILDNFVEVFSENSEILVRKLQNEVGQTFDIFPYITRCALDIICETAMGTPVHAQENIQSPYIAAVYDMSELTIRRLLHFWLHSDFIFNLSSTGKRYKECMKILHGFTNKVIRERKEQVNFKIGRGQNNCDEDGLGKKKRVAFLDMLLEASEGGTKLTDEEIREEVDTFMFEGHDTTSAVMGWAICLLGSHEDVQDKAYEELESIFQGSNRTVTMKDLNDMKYLERVIKEALRLYPSVPGIGRILGEDVKMGNYTIPAGTTMFLYLYFLHRNPEQFPNPEKFDPDNFLPEKVAKRHPYAYVPFSAGPRNCIGQKFAMLELKTVLSQLLRHYKVYSLNKREDIRVIGELIIRPECGIKVILTPRNEQHSLQEMTL